jgi:hypothetical protein
LFYDVLVPALVPSAALGALLVFARAVRATRRVDSLPDAVWLTASSDPGPLASELLGRYLRRVRSHRFNGAVLGTGLALFRGLSHDRNISIGASGRSPLGDLLFGGLAGLLIGSVLAETWRIKPEGTVRSAEIAPRSPDLGATSLRGAVALLTVATLGLGLASRQSRPLALALTSLSLLVTHWFVLRAITGRGRPALPPDLRQADDAIRRFASRRLSIEALATALLLAGWQLASVRPFVPDRLNDWLILASFVGTIVLLHRSRPWPPRRHVARPPSLVT